MSFYSMIGTIRRMLLAGSKTTLRVPSSVSSYGSVIRGWEMYKRGDSMSQVKNLRMVRGVFEFHMRNLDHIILYYSRNMKDCLLLCKVDGKYKNIRVPSEVLDKHNSNIIAVYF